MQRPKLELPINQPVTAEFIFDEPVTGSSQYGPYYMYALQVGNTEYSFFSPADLHEKLKLFRKGDKVTLTKLAAQRGNKLITVYDAVKLANGKHNGNGKLPVNDRALNSGLNGNGKDPSAPSTAYATAADNAAKTTAETDSVPPQEQPDDGLYAIMAKCYRQAFQLQSELSGMIDPEKIAVTLFIARSRNPFPAL